MQASTTQNHCGEITLNGSDWPTESRTSSNVSFALVARDTGEWHRLYSMNYNYITGILSSLSSLSSNTPPAYIAGVMPGVYDLIYQRGLSSGAVSTSHPDDLVPMGWRVLQACVEIP